jgi:CheY-like chemotaxis protein
MTGPILVVDDNFDVLEAMTMVLKPAGYVVITATDGQAALDRLREGLEPSLILLDLMMPGMNGWQFMAELRKDASLIDIPVIIVSGGTYPTAEIASLGAAGYLEKPFDVPTLYSMVEKYA